MRNPRPILALLAGIAAAVLALLAPSGAAAVTFRFAAPSGATSGSCTSAASPCTLPYVLNSAAQTGDDITVEPGAYNLVAQLDPATTSLDIHGEAGAARPVITGVTGFCYPILLSAAGTKLEDLEFDGPSGDCWPLLFSGASADNLILRGQASQNIGGILLQGGTLRNSAVIANQANAVGVEVDGATGLTGDTIEATGSAGDGIDVENLGSGAVTLAVSNSIIGGGAGGVDVHATNASSGTLAVNVDHSDFSSATPSAGNVTVTAPGTNGNVTGAPILANLGSGDLHEAAGSPTIGAGAAGASTGSADFDGDPRVFAAGTACASVDIGADQFQPAAAPVVTTGAASAVTQSSATLAGTANPGGAAQTAHFEYGPAAPGGGPPATLTSTATQCLAPTVTGQSVTATIGSLTPGTVYYYRLVAVNALGTTTPQLTQTFTTPATVTTAPSPAAPPVVTDVSESARTWRESNGLPHESSARRKPPIGTRFSFTASEPATVTLAFFAEHVPGRKVGGRCVAATARNAGKPHCTRRVASGSLSFAAHAGTNSVAFGGRISRTAKLRPGRYTVEISAAGAHGAPQTLSFTIAA
jgi:hypothetical protein